MLLFHQQRTTNEILLRDIRVFCTIYTYTKPNINYRAIAHRTTTTVRSEDPLNSRLAGFYTLFPVINTFIELNLNSNIT